MGKLKFTDGVVLNTDGPYRAVLLMDGWYVLGRGMSIPCDTEDEAKRTAQQLIVEAIKGVDKKADTIIATAINLCDWAAVYPGEPGPGAVATVRNLHHFTPEAILAALNQFRPQITAEFLPVYDKMIAVLTRGK